jgi:uncharacterized protein
MRDGRRILDADAHVVEPAGVFGDAQVPGRNPMDLPPTTPMVPCGDADLLADQWEHGFDAPSYLRAMDAQSIDGVVLYPSVGLFVPFQPELDAAASAAACRSYAEWAAEYCTADPSRLAAVGIAPLSDPKLAAAETRHAADLGLVGMLARPNHLYHRNLGDPAYDPFYDALAETGLVLAVHEGLGLRGATIGSDRFAGFAPRHALSHPMEQMAAMASLMLEGALERHPAMRVAFLESGTGWLPYWLARLDDHREWMADSECVGLSLAPSDYFARQCAISSDPEDPLAPWVASQVGADHLLWASDFPHPDAAYPDALDEFLEKAEGMSAADLDAVLWDTPVRFYGLADRFAGTG